MKSHAYRQAMPTLLARNPEYDRIPKQTRSAIYQLMNNIEDISYHFHNGLNRDLEGEEMA
jgi:hypothetical protein